MFKKKDVMVTVDAVNIIHRGGKKYKQVSFWKDSTRYSTLVNLNAEIPEVGSSIPYSELEKYKLPVDGVFNKEEYLGEYLSIPPTASVAACVTKADCDSLLERLGLKR